MATNTWTDGAADGNWATAGNWSLGAAPVDANDVVINTSSRAITAGLSPAGGSNNFASLTITEGFTGSIGDASTPLGVGCSGATKITVAGAFIKIGGSGLTIASLNANFKSQGELVIGNGTTTVAYIGGVGTLTIGASAVMTTLIAAGPTITAAAGTAITLLVIGAGSYSGARNITELDASNCRVTLTGSATLAATTKAVINSGATYSHQSTGTITLMYLLPGGEFNVDGNINSSAFTLTTLNRAAGSRFRNGGAGWVVNPGTTNTIGIIA